MGKYDMIENRSPGEKAGNIISDEGNCFMEEMRKKGNVIALLPIGVFLVLYLGLGILFEYVMKIPMYRSLWLFWLRSWWHVFRTERSALTESWSLWQKE